MAEIAQETVLRALLEVLAEAHEGPCDPLMTRERSAEAACRIPHAAGAA